jgi:hypothetical protein
VNEYWQKAERKSERELAFLDGDFSQNVLLFTFEKVVWNLRGVGDRVLYLHKNIGQLKCFWGALGCAVLKGIRGKESLFDSDESLLGSLNLSTIYCILILPTLQSRVPLFSN